MDVHTWYMGTKRDFDDSSQLYSLEPVLDKWLEMKRSEGVEIDDAFVDKLRNHFLYSSEMVSTKIREIKEAQGELVHQLEEILSVVRGIDFEDAENKGFAFMHKYFALNNAIKPLEKVPTMFKNSTEAVPSVVIGGSKYPLKMSSYAMKYFAKRSYPFTRDQEDTFMEELSDSYESYKSEYYSRLNENLSMSTYGPRWDDEDDE